MAYDWNNNSNNNKKPKKKGFSFKPSKREKLSKEEKNRRAALGPGSNYRQQQYFGGDANRYDWFRYGTQGEKKGAKHTLKTVWKFSKIFLYLSVFIFSLWGCVQSYTIKSDPRIGAGYEMYLSEDLISPHTTELVFDNTKDHERIYISNKVVWLSDKVEGYDGFLKKAHEEIKANLPKDKNNLSDWIGHRHEALVVDDGGKKILIGAASSGEGERDVAVKAEDIKTNLQFNIWNPHIKTYQSHTFNLKDDVTDDVTNKFTQSELNILSGVARLINDFQTNAPKDLINYLKTAPTGGIDKNYDESVSTLLFYFHINYDFDKNNGVKKVFEAHYMDGRHYFDENSKTWKKDGTGPIQWAGPYGMATYTPINTWKEAWVNGVGPFYALFVYPLSKLMNATLKSMPIMSGWEIIIGIFVITLVTRMLSFMFTFKSLLQQTKTQELQAKKAIVDQKYEAYKGNKQMENRKRQEIQELYKKEGISPLGSIGTLLITMPIFIAVWRVISGTAHIKAGEWAGLILSKTSYKEVFSGNWIYLWIMLVAGAVNGLSAYYPRLLTKRRDKNRTNVQQRAALKKNNKTQNIMIVVQVVMALIFSAGTQIYWIVIALWRVVEQYATHRIIIHQRRRRKRKVVKT